MMGVVIREQIKAARALLNWEQSDLADEARVSLGTIGNIERGVTDPLSSTVTKVQQALEKAGIEFTNGEAPGVRLKPTKRKR